MAGMNTRNFTILEHRRNRPFSQFVPHNALLAFLLLVGLLVLVGLPGLTFSAEAFAQTTQHSNSVFALQDGFVDANGVMIYYVTVGRGAPLVIVHGGPGASHDYFLPYLLPLARHNKLIFID